jgi:pimeloyl-ACP methyl ester carboxylesterase
LAPDAAVFAMDLARWVGEAGADTKIEGTTALKPMAMTYETPGGVRLAADVTGEATKGSVILAHGGGQTRHSWAAAARRLADRGFKAVSLDLRGHGESEWAPDGDYGMTEFAADLVAVAATLPGRPHLIGASLGGMAGLMVETVVEPGTFETLTLVDIIPESDPVGVDKIMGFMGANLEHGFASLEEAADSIAAYLPHRKRPTDLSGLSKNLRRGADGRFRWHWDPKFVTNMRRGEPGPHTEAFDTLRARCREIEVPVHLIRGRMSELVSADGAKAFVATLRNGSFTDVADAGHMVAGDRNDVFIEAVLGFLDRRE